MCILIALINRKKMEENQCIWAHIYIYIYLFISSNFIMRRIFLWRLQIGTIIITLIIFKIN